MFSTNAQGVTPPVLPMETALGRIKATVAQGSWFNVDNVYLKDVCSTVKSDFKNGLLTDGLHLQDFIAASSPLHCFDGWSYLGRALHAHMSGDELSSLHLAYYAELRAALSILSSNGTGCFNQHHVMFETNGTPRFFQGSTHSVTWTHLQSWLSQPTTAAEIDRMIGYDHNSLETWLAGFANSSNVSSVSSGWVKEWSVDINSLKADRTARNEASYRSNASSMTSKSGLKKSMRLVLETWPLLQPQGSQSFGILDRYLIRLALERQFGISSSGVSNVTRITNPRLFGARIDRTVDQLGYAGSDALEWKAFLKRQGVYNRDPLVLSLASRSPMRQGESIRNLPVLARSVLLLRIATGISCNLLKASGYILTDISRWLEKSALDLGFLNASETLIDPADFWSDIYDALGDYAYWADANPPSNRERSDVYTDIESPARAILQLGSTERVALWALLS